SESLGALNQIRARAGMPAYTLVTQDLIRNERFVEFAFENKNYWDYVRWRTLTTAFSNRPEYGLRIYWDIDTQDYVFIKIPVATKTYVRNDYFFDFPAADISSSPAIAQQVNAGHNPGY
ncbi:MAG: starch-binding outer membrane protein SusD/RagB family, partial [Mucilaginibacter sp.]|nr:starch-binding outer membrane protein SusD/RagB family [Mucilaginibacter sp.]